MFCPSAAIAGSQSSPLVNPNCWIGMSARAWSAKLPVRQNATAKTLPLSTARISTPGLSGPPSLMGQPHRISPLRGVPTFGRLQEMGLDPQRVRFWGLLSGACGLLLVGTGYFGSANPLFFGRIPGIELGCVLCGVGVGLWVLSRRLGR